MKAQSDPHPISVEHSFVLPRLSPPPSRVVLCVPGYPLAAAVKAAQSTFGSLAGVRVVAYGATLLGESLLEQHPGLELAELGAYAKEPVLAAVQSIQRCLDDWLDAVFADTLGEGRPARILRASAEARLIGFGQLIEVPTVTGFIEEHRTADVLVVGGDWWAIPTIRASIERVRVFSQAPHGAPRRRLGRLVFVVAHAAGTALSCLNMIRDHAAGRVARREARRRAPAAPPNMWLVVSSDRKKLNLHILEVAAGIKDVSLGMLVFPPFAPVEHVEPRLRRVRRRAPWPALRGNDFADTLPLELVDGWPQTSQLARGLLRFLGSAFTVGLRVLAGPTEIRAGAHTIDLFSSPGRLARLCTIDLLRAQHSLAAARRIVQKYDLSDRFVVFAMSNLSDAAALHVGLQQGAAMTVDYFHGWMMEPVPIACDSPSRIRCVWAYTDRDLRDEQRTRNAVYAHGAAARYAKGQCRKDATRLLILSNYSHRDAPAEKREYQSLLQREIVRTGMLLRTRFPAVEMRWRPHPADLEELVAPDARQAALSGIQVSQGRPLAEDLEWAHVCASSVSTAAIEAMIAGCPVFVHVQPEYSAQVGWISANRRFFRAEHGAALLTEYLSLDAGARTDEHERRSLGVLLGESPASDLLEALRNAQ